MLSLYLQVLTCLLTPKSVVTVRTVTEMNIVTLPADTYLFTHSQECRNRFLPPTCLHVITGNLTRDKQTSMANEDNYNLCSEGIQMNAVTLPAAPQWQPSWPWGNLATSAQGIADSRSSGQAGT